MFRQGSNNMRAVPWGRGIFPLPALLLALVGVFTAPSAANAFFAVTPSSRFPRAAAATTADRGRSVALDGGERKRQSTALFGIKRKVDGMQKSVSVSVHNSSA